MGILLGIAIGYPAFVLLARPRPVDPTPTPTLTTTQPAQPTTTTSAVEVVTTTTAFGSTSTAPVVPTYLVWSSGGLDPAFTTALLAAFPQASVFKGGVVELVGETGLIPLDALAGQLPGLGPGSVALGESSAALRRAQVGDTLALASGSVEVVAVVPDSEIGAAEIVFARDDPNLPFTIDRFALVTTDLPRADFEGQVRSFPTGPGGVRIRAEGETPWLRHGDAVIPQVFVKEALGEFSYTNLRGAGFTPDPAWVDGNIVRSQVPILGEVVCHRIVTEMLTSALGRLVDEGLSHLVDPTSFAGCFDPRYIRTAAGQHVGVSRHAWGAAVDINAAQNPLGSLGTQDPRLIAAMVDAGFTWGGEWLVPDPMHFEYAG